LLSDGKKLALWLLMMVALLLGLLLISRRGLNLDTNLLSLLPVTEIDPVVMDTSDRFTEEMSARVVFMVSAPQPEQAGAAAAWLQERLNEVASFSQIRGKLDDNTEEAWFKLYFPFRYQLLSGATRARLGAEDGAKHLIRQAQEALYSPMSGLYSRLLEDDPLLLFAGFLKGLPKPPGDLKLHQGWLAVDNPQGRHIMLTAACAQHAFKRQGQRSVAKAMVSIREEMATAFPSVSLASTGVVHYAAAGAAIAEQEATTIGLGSILGVVCLFLFVFRAIRPLLLGILPIAVGFLAALVVCFLVFDEVHLLTLGFGASMVGICIDYTFHFFTHRMGQHNSGFPKEILPAISLGAITTIVGYFGLLIAPFPGLRQMALFSIVGLVAAFLTVVLAFPKLAATTPVRTSTGLAGSAAYLAFWRRLCPGHLAAFGAPLALFTLLGLARVQSDDDIRGLSRPPANLKAQEDIIRKLAGSLDASRFLLVEGATPEDVLQHEEALHVQLDALIAEGKLGFYQNLSRLLPSQRRQQADRVLLRDSLLGDNNALDGYLEDMGFEPEVGVQARTSLADEPTSFLTMDNWLQDPASDQMRFLWLGATDRGYAAMTVLGGLTDLNAPAQLSAPEYVHYIDKVTAISSLMARYRHLATRMVVLSYLAVFVLLALRYGWRRGLRVFLPPVAAALLALAMLGWLGFAVNLFHILALLLVLGIGIDYTIFFAESGPGSRTMLAILLSAITTILSFGLLGLSSTPVLESLGLTVLFGILAAWFLSPLAAFGMEQHP